MPALTFNSLVIGGTCALSGNGLITLSATFSIAAGKTVQAGLSGARIDITLAATATGTINGTLTMDPGTSQPHPFTVNGTLIMGPLGVVNGDGDFVLGNTGTLKIGSPAGISTAGATGNIQMTAGSLRTFPASANYTYNGVANQSTGTGLPTLLTGTLEINNPGFTVTLSAARATANGGSILVTAGTFATAGLLTLATTSDITINGGSFTGTPAGAGVYDVIYGGNNNTTGTELAGAGLRNVTVGMAAGQTLTLSATRIPDGNLSVTTGIFDLGAFTINKSATGGTLTVANAATLKIGGTNSFPTNYTVSHVLGATSTIEYSGTAQTVTNETYGNLTVSGGGNKTLAASTTIATTLTLTSGKLVVPSTMVLTLNPANAVGGTLGAVNHIVTQVDYTTNAQGFVSVLNIPSASTYTFATGNGTYYFPVTLTPSGATAGNDFRVSTFTGLNANGLPNGTPTAKANVVDAVWTVNNDNGTTTPAVAMTLGWSADGSPLEGSSFSTLAPGLIGISHYGGTWGTYQNTSAASNTAPNFATLASVTSFSPFSVGLQGPANATLPIKIYYFNASKANSVNTLNWNAECSGPQANFEIERSADGRSFTSINKITASQARCAFPFSFDDVAPLAGTSFYRVKMIDNNGNVTYTAIVKLGGTTKDIQLAGILPNPVSNTAQLNITTTKKDNVELSVISMEGKVIAQKTVQLQSGSSFINLDVSTLVSGTYFVRGVFGDGQSSSIKFVKQ